MSEDQDTNKINKSAAELQDDLIKRIQELDQKLAMFQQGSESAEEKKKNLPDLNDLPIINTKGDKVMTTEEIREKYANSPSIIRSLQLPFCYSSVIGKTKFWMIGGLGAAFIWEFKKLIESRKKLRDFSKRKFLRTYTWITLAGVTFSIAESLLFEPFCDIRSYHYNPSIDSKLKIQRLKDDSRQI